MILTIYITNPYILNEVLRHAAAVPCYHLLFVWPVPYYLSGKASFKLC